MTDDTPDDVRAVDRLYGIRPGMLVPDRDLRDVVTGEQPFDTGPVWVFDPATGQHNGAGFFPGGRHQRAAAAAVVLLAGKVWSTLPTPAQRPGMEAWEGAAAAWAMTGTAWEGDTEARDRLTRAIQRHALDLLRPAWPTSGELEDVMNALVELGTLTDDGVSRLSVMLADHLRGMGDTEGAELWLAADREAQAAETHPALADGWGGGALDLPSWTVIDARHRTTRAHRALAYAVWTREVYPELDRITPNVRTSPALPLPFAQGISRAMGRAVVVDTDGERPRLVIRDDTGKDIHTLGHLDVPLADAAAVRRAAAGLRTVHAARVFRWLWHAAWETRGDPVEVAGGWSGMTSAVGLPKGKAVRKVEAGSRAIDALRVSWATGAETRIATFGTPDGRRGPIRWTFHEPLMPGFAFHASKGRQPGSVRTRRELSRLVPLPADPPLVGRPNEHGALLWLQVGVVAFMRSKGAEMRDHDGFVTVTGDDWKRLAFEHGWPGDVDALVGAWTAGTDTEPPFLERAGDRYRIARNDTHRRVAAFLEAGPDRRKR